MNGFAITGLFFVAIPSAILGVFCLLRGRKKVHLIWSAFLISVTLWGVGMFKVATSVTLENSLFWWRIAEVGVILIPVFLIHFVIAFLGLKRRILLIASYLTGAFFIYLDLFTNYLIHDLYFAFNEFYYIKDTPFYTALICFFVLAAIYSIYELNRVYEKSEGIIRTQIKYLIIALFIGFLGGVTSYPPVYGIKVIYPIWNGTIFISALMISYAILKYRLMDIRIIIRKFVFYAMMAALVYGFFYFLLWFYNSFLGGAYTAKTYAVGLVVAPAFVAVFILMNKWFKKITSRYLFYDLYSYQEAISGLAKKLSNSIDLNKIINSIVDTIKETMNLNRAGVLLIDTKKGEIRYRIAKIIGFNETNGISLVQDNFLTKYLQKTQKALVREELSILAKESKNKADKKSFEKLAKNAEKIEASLCLPLISGSKLIGIIVLGSKNSGDAYTKEDLQLLEMLSLQAAVAIENARLYKEVDDLSKNLQQKVAEQTKRIRTQKDKVEKALKVEKQAHKLEKKALEDLRQLDANKTNFMLITQHHLRTPLSVNAGFIDLILGGTFGKIPAKLKRVILRLKESTQKEIDVVNELLDVSSYQIGKEAIHLDKLIDIEALIEETLKDLTGEAKAKGIYLKYEKQGEIPKIPADRLKLKLVLTNVIDNCIKYTAEGGVTVTMEVKNNKLLISVIDTGIGLSDKIIKNLFKQTFHRGEKAKRLFAVGKGLGLFLSGKVVEGHNGKIWAESKGDGKGSMFFIELPTKQKKQQSTKVENNISESIK